MSVNQDDDTRSSQASQNNNNNNENEQEVKNSSTSNIAVGLVGDTYDDIKQSFSQFLLVKMWWRDIGRRVGSEYHYTTLFTGSILIPIAILAYILAFELNPPEGVDSQYRHYICASMSVALCAQFFFSFHGICFENAAMLLAANVVAGAIALRIIVRPLLDNDHQTGRTVERWIIEGVICLFCIIHFIASFLAWRANEGFRRFIFFAIGGTTRIQNRYRVFQAWKACSRVDIFFTILTCMSIGFFCGEIWWHYVLLVLVVLVNAIWRSMLLKIIRTETCIAECFQTTVISGEQQDDPNEEERQNATEEAAIAEGQRLTTAPNAHREGEEEQEYNSFEHSNNQQQQQGSGAPLTNSQRLFGTHESRLEASGMSLKPSYPIPSWWSFVLVALLNLNSPLVLGFALFSKDFVRADIPDYSYFLVFTSFSFFLAARVLLTIATVFAWRNFGKGMKDVFAKERGVAEFLLGTRSMHSARHKRRQEQRAKNGGAASGSKPASVLGDDDEDEDPFAAAAKSARAGKYGTV